MLGAHDDNLLSFDTVDLLLGKWPGDVERSEEKKCVILKHWSELFDSNGKIKQDTTRKNILKEPQTDTECDIHTLWSPSMETPKTVGTTSIGDRLERIEVVTSPDIIKSPDKTRHHDNNSPLKMYGGFMTGNGRKLEKPGEAAMARAKKLVVADSPKRKLVDETDFVLHAEKELKTSIEKPKTWKDALKPSEACKLYEEALAHGVPDAICRMNSQTASEFCFSQIGQSPWDVGSAYEDLQSLLLLKGKKNLVTFPWVQNHFRWIIWKLGSIARRFPDYLTRFSAKQVLGELHARCLQEIVDGKRHSIIRKIVEKDDAPQRPMILLISRVYHEDKNTVELSDGWYSVKAYLDKPLSEVGLRKGMKIITANATLQSEEAVAALEAINSSQALRLACNSTRRAPWHLKLGLYKKPLFMVKSIRCDGGRVVGIEALVVKRYPLCYSVEDSYGNRSFLTRWEYDRLIDELSYSPDPKAVSAFKNARVRTWTRLLLKGNTILNVWDGEDMITKVKPGDVLRIFNVTPGRPQDDGTIHLHSNPTSSLIINHKPGCDGGVKKPSIQSVIPSQDRLPRDLDISARVLEPPTEAANRKLMSIVLEDDLLNTLCVFMPVKIYKAMPNCKFKPDQKITMTDLRFLHYDRVKGFPVYTFTDRSDILRI